MVVAPAIACWTFLDCGEMRRGLVGNDIIDIGRSYTLRLSSRSGHVKGSGREKTTVLVIPNPSIIIIIVGRRAPDRTYQNDRTA